LLAAAVGTPVADASGATSLAIDARAEDHRLLVAVTGRGPALRRIADAPVVREVRERLRVLHGEGASLRIDEEPARRLTLMLDIPHAHA